MKKIFIFSLSLLSCCWLHAQERIQKTFPAQGISHFVISNIAGGIDVLASDTDEIKITATVERGKLGDGLSIDFKQGSDYLIYYLRTPCTKDESAIQFDPPKNDGLNFWKNNCDWNKSETDPLPKINYRVELPKDIALYLYTIMEGDVIVKNSSAQVSASNVNGAITLDQVAQVARAKTVNGDININLQEVPRVAGDFSTINGDITLKVPSSIKATSSFKTFNGHFYTNLKSVDEMTSGVIKKNDENGFKYKVDNKREIKFDGGGIQLDFETFNGDVYLTQKS